MTMPNLHVLRAPLPKLAPHDSSLPSDTSPCRIFMHNVLPRPAFQKTMHISQAFCRNQHAEEDAYRMVDPFFLCGAWDQPHMSCQQLNEGFHT